MADFRRFVLVLAVLAAFVIPASAQGPQATCNFGVSPTTVRVEGLAELAGDIVLSCSTNGVDVPTSIIANFTAPVTSKPLSGGLTEAILTVGAGAPIFGKPFGANSLSFEGVTIPATASPATVTIRITNVRVNANSQAVNSQVFGFVSVSPASSVVFTNNPNGPVASVQTGLIFAEASGKDTNPGPLSFLQCATGTAQTVNLKFTEGFGAAFKSQPDENGTVVGVAGAGTASTGTRIFARFTQIPANVTLGVPAKIILASGSEADLVGFDPAAVTQPALPDALTSGPLKGQIQVPISGTTGTVVYEIKTADNTVAETFPIPVSIAVSAGVAVTSSATLPTVGGGLAPVTTSTSVVPRFVDVSTTNTATLFSVSSCVTNLLFPFVTNAAGFDTGIALVNTSLDNAGSKAPFNTTTQHGACTVFFFNGTTTAPTPQTTADIPAGGMVAFTLQGGGVAGSTSSAAGFQGYIIAQCNFQFAHGFAFISDRNTPSLGSQGYLALVIPDRGGARLAQNFTTGSPAGIGEQLAQ